MAMKIVVRERGEGGGGFDELIFVFFVFVNQFLFVNKLLCLPSPQ